MAELNPLAPEWLREPENINQLESALWPDNTHRSRGTEVLGRGAAPKADAAPASGGGSAPNLAEPTNECEIIIDEAPVSELAAEYGTPLYVVDKPTAIAQAKRIKSAFESALAAVGSSAKVYYASKALLTTDVVRWMLAGGLNIDVASGGELAIAAAAGAPGARLGLHGNNKSAAELREALAMGVGNIVLDSLAEIDFLSQVIGDLEAELGKTLTIQPVSVRVTTGVHASTHEFLATAREDQKFGIAVQDVLPAVQKIRANPKLQFMGMHSHIGSQIFDTNGFAEAIQRLLKVHAQLLQDGDVPQLNLGGGYGIAYTPADHPKNIEDIAQGIAQVLKAECDALKIPVPKILIEPGRSIIGRAGVTLYRVGTVKDVQVSIDAAGAADGTEAGADVGSGVQTTAIRKYVSVDGGMSDNVRPALYDADYHAVLANRASSANPQLCRVVGKHCESGDIVVKDVYLPADVQRGDLIAVADTGAYCFSLSSNYNMLPRPAMVSVDHGDSRLMIFRESVSDLLIRDAGAFEKFEK